MEHRGAMLLLMLELAHPRLPEVSPHSRTILKGSFWRVSALFFDFSDGSEHAADLEAFACCNHTSTNLFPYCSN